jgi:oligogalacturonide transport system permease protein
MAVRKTAQRDWRKRSRIRRRRETLTAYGFLSPWLLGFVLFSAFPFFYSLYLSVCEVKFTISGVQTRFIGVGNYVRAIVGEGQLDFVPALLEFAGMALVYTPLILVFSLVLAMLLKQKIRAKGLFRAIYFIPVIILSGPLFNEMSNNGSLHIAGIADLVFLRMVAAVSPQLMHLLLYLFDNIIVIFWFSGVQIVIFLNALQKIDHSLYEASAIDGATAWQTFWMITLPIIRPMTVLVSIYSIVQLGAFSSNKVSQLIRANLFALNVGAGYGYSAALSWIFFLVMIVLISLFFGVLRKKEKSPGGMPSSAVFSVRKTGGGKR